MKPLPNPDYVAHYRSPFPLRLGLLAVRTSRNWVGLGMLVAAIGDISSIVGG